MSDKILTSIDDAIELLKEEINEMKNQRNYYI